MDQSERHATPPQTTDPRPADPAPVRADHHLAACTQSHPTSRQPRSPTASTIDSPDRTQSNGHAYAAGMTAADCPFCAIARGELSAEVVLETDELIGFLDVRPVFKGHTLIVPRTHVATLTELPTELMTPLLEAGQRMARAVVEALGAQGSFVAMNNVVSQSVPHLHLHVVPRTKGDGLRGFFWPRTKYVDDAERADYAERLRAVL
ncbi:hypothetical protein GCM10025862_31090 [Arsenicicoccus piscis]|uniref:HIT domain-containing protein n=2 Tax=Arsenicicoccus piscis TaxID=673954 RepID=A0ABQ6HRK6_9MICO|nr:hypothetical protein GCM10025862_31090 [Arsenicicoccus piscis]